MESLLIVDDDPAIREIFTILLTEHGYTVKAASGAQECLDVLTDMVPDLVMLDIMMYPVDGWETLAAIRTNPRTTVIPAIMFSGKSPSREEIDVYGGWIEDYFMKPASMQMIKTSLRGVFDRYRSSQAERDHFLQDGGDPAMIEEYLALKRFLFIRDKFSREWHEAPEGPGQLVLPQKIRFEELGQVLSSRPSETSRAGGRERL